MTHKTTWRRWFSRRFTAAAAALLPRLESPWGDAMKAEIEAIEDDRDSLRWALGCLRTACVRRLGAGLRDHRNVRALVAGYLALTSIAVFWVVSQGVVHQISGWPAFDYSSIPQPTRERLALLVDSWPAVIYLFMSGTLLLATAAAVVTRRLRTAAELSVTQFVMDWIFGAVMSLLFPPLAPMFAPRLSLTIVLNVFLPIWLWCARSVERETLETSAR